MQSLKNASEGHLFDLQQEQLTGQTLKDGVSACFVLCASKEYFASSFCIMEVTEALLLNKPIVLLYDERAVFNWSGIVV